MDTDLAIWQQALYSVSDDAFLSIMRNYLGPIQTPFNKPNLIHQLTTFLTSEETQKRIILLIDSLDRKLLSAIHFLEHADINTLYSLFSSHMSFFQVQQAIFNLEERLLVYQVRDSHVLSINPLVRDVLIPGVIRFDQLLDHGEEDETTWRPPAHRNQADAAKVKGTSEFPDNPFINRTAFFHILSFVSHRNLEERSDGVLKKRSLDSLVSSFIYDSPKVLFANMLAAAIEGLKSIGVLIPDGQGVMAPNHAFLKHISTIAWRDLSIGLFTAAVFKKQPESYEENISPVLQELMYDLFSLLKDMERVSHKNLTMLIRIVTARASNRLRKENSFIPESVISKLIDIQVISPSISVPPSKQGVKQTSDTYGEAQQTVYTVRPDLDQLLDSTQDSSGSDQASSVVMDSDLTLGVSGHIPLADIYPMYLYCEPVQCGNRFATYAISKASVRYAFDRGLTAKDIQSNLNDVIHDSTPLPQHIVLTLQNWQSEYESISLYNGIVLQSDGMHARIIDAHPELRKYILHRLAPGIYIMDPVNESVWRDILVKSGMGMLPETKDYSQRTGADDSITFNPSTHRSSTWFVRDEVVSADPPGEDMQCSSDSDSCKQQLIQALEQEIISKRLHGTIREEYSAKIQKKLILYPEQISGAHLQRNVWEASGLDFTGKMNLCRQAIASPSELLEIHLNLPDEEQVYLIRPMSLEKRDRGAILTGSILPDGTHISIEVGKILLLRKLRSSLFTPLS